MRATYRAMLRLLSNVIIEQCTYELRYQLCIDKNRFPNPDKAVHCTQKYVLLRHWLPLAVKWWSLWTLNEPPSGSQFSALKNMHIFRLSVALLYTVHCNQANAFILVEILVISTCLADVRYCSDFWLKKNLCYVRKTPTSTEYSRWAV